MGPNGSENFNTLLLLQVAIQILQTCPEFSSQWRFEILSFRFLTIFFLKIHHCGLWRNKNLNYLENEQSESSSSGASILLFLTVCTFRNTCQIYSQQNLHLPSVTYIQKSK